MFQHVLCVYPYRRDLKRTKCFPPIGLEHIAAVLTKYCHKIDVVDLRYETTQTNDFLHPETDLVCFSVNWQRDIDFVTEQISSVPAGPTIIVGGRHATEDPDKWLKECPNIDIVVRGDGEPTIKEIAQGRSLKTIKGISYRQDNKIFHNSNQRYQPLDDALYPQRSLRRYDYRFDIEGINTSWTFDSLSASRGCPFKCKFCSFTLNPWGEKRAYTSRSAESVVRELEQIKAKIVVFTDDIFTHNMKWVEDICDLIIKKGIQKRYVINARLEMANRMDVVAKMERAGFTALLLGIESTQDRTLRSMNKGFTTKQIEKYCEILKRTKMILHGYFILGNLGETEAEMHEIAPFARRLGIDTLGLSALRTSPYDGLKELIAANPKYHISEDGLVFSDEISTGKLHQIRKHIWREFYRVGHVLKLAGKLRQNEVLTARTVFELIKAGLLALWAKRPRLRRTQK